MAKVYHEGTLLWEKVSMADNPMTRFKGLMGRRKLSDDEGLLITPCNQVHTFHMRFTIDVLFMAKDRRVVAITTLKPWKIGPRIKGAAFVLEVPAYSAGHFNVKPGDYLTIEHERC